MEVIKHINQLDLQLDESYRGDCPACNGRNTFTVTKQIGNLLYNCYKAGCSLSGVTKQSISIQDLQKERKNTKKDFEMPSYIMPAGDSTKNSPTFYKFSSAYGLNLDDIKLYYDLKEQRIVFPIIHEYRIVDAIGRASHPKVQPKWRRYGASGYGYKMGSGNVVVLVEDCISAAVVATTFDNCIGFALLGTNFLASYHKQLNDVSTIIVALDPDASNKSLDIKRELCSHTNAEIFAFRLEDDLKYRKKYDITRLQEKINNVKQ